VATRAVQVVAELDAGTVEVAVLCAHGGLIAGLTASLLRLPVSCWSVFRGIGNCRWTVLQRPGPRLPTVDTPWRLVTYNAGLLG
jgi:broad specificity phosphatase PhoE